VRWCCCCCCCCRRYSMCSDQTSGPWKITRSPSVPVFHRQLITSFPPPFWRHTLTDPTLLKNRNGHGQRCLRKRQRMRSQCRRNTEMNSETHFAPSSAPLPVLIVEECGGPGHCFHGSWRVGCSHRPATILGGKGGGGGGGGEGGGAY
jgi:hypothetical protein